MKKTKLIEVAKTILIKNPKGYLSGSLALDLQNFKTRRQPNDIDIFMPYGSIFEKIDGMADYDKGNNVDYDDEDYKRQSFIIKGANPFEDIEIDVLTAINEAHPTLMTEMSNGVDCIRFDEILKFKINHYITGETSGRFKHKDDIIYFMVSN